MIRGNPERYRLFGRALKYKIEPGAFSDATFSDDLRPVADLVARTQKQISHWLDRPAHWTRAPVDDEERAAALAPIRKAVFSALHDLAETRLAEQHQPDWVTAFDHAGSGSTYRRAEDIDSIYRAAAPPIEAAMSNAAREFVQSLSQLVRTSVEANGGLLQDKAHQPAS